LPPSFGTTFGARPLRAKRYHLTKTDRLSKMNVVELLIGGTLLWMLVVAIQFVAFGSADLLNSWLLTVGVFGLFSMVLLPLVANLFPQLRRK
jgi:hypothetical protein